VVTIPLAQLDDDLDLPAYALPGDAGCDLRAAESLVLEPGGGRAAVRTGVAIALPEGYAGFVLPRSGLARDHGVTCLNAPGLIDAGYRGEISVVLVNLDPTMPFTVQRGDRIAQLVIQAVEQATFVPTSVEELPDSARGAGGFGHSGRS